MAKLCLPLDSAPITLPRAACARGGIEHKTDCMRFEAGSSTRLRRSGVPFRLRGWIDSPIPFPEPTLEDVTAETRQAYAGRLVVGEDLKAFELGENVELRLYPKPGAERGAP